MAVYVLVPSFKNGYESRRLHGALCALAILLIWLTSAIVRGAISYRPGNICTYLAYLVLFFVAARAGYRHIVCTEDSGLLDLLRLLPHFVALWLRHVFGFDKLATN